MSALRRDGCRMIYALLVLVVLLNGAIFFYVSRPRRITCPQCKGSGMVAFKRSPKKAAPIVPQKCPYCGGTKAVWR